MKEDPSDRSLISSILKAYDIPEFTNAEPIVSGLINRTWKISTVNDVYILQRVNDGIFKRPFELADNSRMIDDYLREQSSGYLFVAPLLASSKEGVVFVLGHGYFRLFPFITGSHTINVVTTPDQAFEASRQFGKFTSLLSGFDSTKLHTTIPDFHNLSLRYQQFENATLNGDPERIKQSFELISQLKSHIHILSTFEKIQNNKAVKLRVMHHDTKISNVLFDDQGKGLCVIDLDTVMPGYFISDVGDMMRTYLSPANEEEKDFSKIEVRNDYFRAIVQGYLSTMRSKLTDDELGFIFYSGLFLIYMQAIRFLADHCNNDSYYGAKYENHNFIRAENQIWLLKRLLEKQSLLQKIIGDELKKIIAVKD